MLHQHEVLALGALAKGAKQVDELCEETGLGKDALIRALLLLKEKGAARLEEAAKSSYSAKPEGAAFATILLPELRLLKKAQKAPVGFASLPDDEMKVGLPWALRNGWVKIREEGGEKRIIATDAGAKGGISTHESMAVLRRVAEKKPAEANDKQWLEQFLKRGLIALHESTEISSASITEEGKRLLKEEGAAAGEINVLTKELITSGKWKGAKFREYDLDAPVERTFPGKRHPLRQVIERIRSVFIELGFEEMEGSMIESSFWNFDALFQPQDHPARDLADTFYLLHPDRIGIPDEELAKKVAKAHKKGWKYSWEKSVAEQPVLRTHTTAVSARYVAETGMEKRPAPAKYFLIGRVYRNEATDYKHLAEFHQIDGIVIDEDANFRDLLGILKEFYRKLGFEQIRFRPSYFPYTEPSLEIEVFHEEKGEWLELGGAGIFRPEICLSLWGKYPVLAWGLSLERPTMLMMDLGDIRTFYKNDLGWLRNTPSGKSWV